MPGVPGADKVVALVTGDVHLSHKPPVARSGEPDWYAAQGRPLRAIREQCETLQVPLLIAGDLFHTWNEPAETIAFALRELPDLVFAVPGQHDLPYHQYRDLPRSAYGVLVEAGRIVDLKPGQPVELISRGTPLSLHGFPWGFPPKPAPSSCSLSLDIAVVHATIWDHAARYPGAPEGGNILQMLPQLQGYDAGVFGDNHRAFHYDGRPGRAFVYNCGPIIRRTVDEKTNGGATVGLLYADGRVERAYLAIDQEVWLDAEALAKSLEPNAPDFAEVLSELRELSSAAVRFEEIVRRVATQCGASATTRAAVERVLGESHDQR